MPSIKSIPLKRKELLTYHCGCHGNLVITASRHVADAYVPKEHHSKYEVNTSQDKGVTK